MIVQPSDCPDDLWQRFVKQRHNSPVVQASVQLVRQGVSDSTALIEAVVTLAEANAQHEERLRRESHFGA